MPHFIIHCTKDVLDIHDERMLIKEVHSVATKSGLFEEDDIKVRVQDFECYLVGGKNDDCFIHVFAHIMQGGTEAQKANLSRSIVKKLVDMFPSVTNIAMNVDEFTKSTYCNKSHLC
ncbi:5-carboxymethyl-2-hydroxymuconate Delta-isomerase [Pleionea sediminis]|uniref:5-carboxymethyl-2-hydroxymuconate Delta-isomerase n=1 Tax=Pleionea sediminis TaxID=2569479 RepID=UPI001184EC41|nr:5-carboxymethyl-2-hydroxymuconate Delta-isomerase [Pleionea sediminis]